MAITYTHTFNGKTTIVGQDFDDNFSDIASKFNGGIVNADVNINAAIDRSKLAHNRFLTTVVIDCSPYVSQAANLPAAGTIIGIAPFPEASGETAWVVRRGVWVCTDTGAGDGKIDIVFGRFSNGAWASGSENVIAEAVTLNDVSGNDATSEDCGIDDVAITTASTADCFVVRVDTQGTNYMTAATEHLVVTLMLERTLTS